MTLSIASVSNSQQSNNIKHTIFHTNAVIYNVQSLIQYIDTLLNYYFACHDCKEQLCEPDLYEYIGLTKHFYYHQSHDL